MKAQQAVRLAWQHHTIVPAFNIPYLPMVEPVVQAIIDENSVAMVQVARLEWEKFESQSPEAVAKEYFKFCKEGYTLLHLVHADCTFSPPNPASSFGVRIARIRPARNAKTPRSELTLLRSSPVRLMRESMA